MAVVKAPFLSFEAHGTVGKTLTCRQYYNKYVMQKYPDYRYICTELQLAERDRFRRFAIIDNYFTEIGHYEMITEIRPEYILDPAGSIYRFDMSCIDIGFGNMTLDLGLGIIDSNWAFEDDEFRSWHERHEINYK